MTYQQSNNVAHPQYRHGMAGTRPYRIWTGMKNRCLNKNERSYQRYGAVGIGICKRWMEFSLFWKDMKGTYFDEAQIDRIDNRKGYSPANCRWATLVEQARNKTNLKLYDFDGGKLPLSEVAKRVGIKRLTIFRRMKLGWSFDDATSKPLKDYGKNRGIMWDKNRSKYTVKLKRGGKTMNVGRYKTLQEAIRARNAAILELIG